MALIKYDLFFKLFKLVALMGGARLAFHKVVNVYHEEGIPGIERRLKFAFRKNGFLVNNNYSKWLSLYDNVTDESRACIVDRIKTIHPSLFISLVMPVYNPRKQWLSEAIESVKKQLYPHWELCIADDASTDPAIRPLLERFANEDSRIKVVFREKNGHISAASNSALALVTGQWVALLDHDDVLPEHALYCVAERIFEYPEAQLVYSDEDKIDEEGKRHSPYFKCNWNVDLFYCQNMFSHFGVYRKSLVDKVGGFRLGFEGAQDYDLTLRCAEHIPKSAIIHIPRVLYHWREHKDSTASGSSVKPYAASAGERALNEHFERIHLSARAEFVGVGYRVHYALPDILPLVSLIIPTRNGLTLIRQCIDSIINKTTYSNYEIIVVDNASDDEAVLRYFQEISCQSNIRILRDESPFNYSALNNKAVTQARGSLIALINNDIEVISPDWLSEMVSVALQPQVGAVGAKLLYPDGTLQHGGVILGLGGVAAHSHKHLRQGGAGYFQRCSLSSSFSAVTAACLVVEKAKYEEVGGLNERDLAVAFNDVDFCLRLKETGYRNVWTPYAVLTHHESATRGVEDNPEKRARFAREVTYMKECWGKQLMSDPAYSPNLTLDYEDFSFSWPPRVNELGCDIQKELAHRKEKV